MLMIRIRKVNQRFRREFYVIVRKAEHGVLVTAHGLLGSDFFVDLLELRTNSEKSAG